MHTVLRFGTCTCQHWTSTLDLTSTCTCPCALAKSGHCVHRDQRVLTLVPPVCVADVGKVSMVCMRRQGLDKHMHLPVHTVRRFGKGYQRLRVTAAQISPVLPCMLRNGSCPTLRAGRSLPGHSPPNQFRLASERGGPVYPDRWHDAHNTCQCGPSSYVLTGLHTLHARGLVYDG